MIKRETAVEVTDNSGAKTALVFGMYGGTGTDTARVGDLVKVAIKSVIPNSKLVKKGDVFLAVIVRTVYPQRRKDGSMARAGDNAIVLLNPQRAPIASRVFGYVAKEVAYSHIETVRKVVSLATKGVY